ncbi:MAG TPA: hypothetical protein VFQ79_15350 [Bryobacteraceae bacterium]|nr:hypothetical protein [Bryobacteraceae bacterium]
MAHLEGKLPALTCLLAFALLLSAQDTRPVIGEQHYRIYHGDGRPARDLFIPGCDPQGHEKLGNEC